MEDLHRAPEIDVRTPSYASLIGEETSGLRILDEMNNPLPDLNTGTSIVTYDSGGVQWHKPTSW